MHNRLLKLIGAFLFIILLAFAAVLLSTVVFSKEMVIVPQISPDLTGCNHPRSLFPINSHLKKLWLP
jgi:hypothetical protein